MRAVSEANRLPLLPPCVPFNWIVHRANDVGDDGGDDGGATTTITIHFDEGPEI